MIKKKLVFEKNGIEADGALLSADAANIVYNRFGMGPKKTKVIVKNLDTGNVQETHNKVLVAGAQWTASMHWGLDNIIQLPSYNQDLNLDEPADIASTDNVRKIRLFCCGTNGCGLEQSQIYDVDYTKRIQPQYMIPFRYQKVDNDLADSMRDTYFGRKTIDDQYYAYYFKKPNTDPQMYAQYIDGTPLDGNLYNSQNTMEAELYVETVLMITKDDFRDFFINTTGINTAKMNQFSLCQAWEVTDPDGHKWYKDITPVTQVNISTESLVDLTKGVEITYQTYY